MKKISVVMALAAIFAGSWPSAGEEPGITTATMFKELTDLSALTKAAPEGTRMIQFSSYDRLSEKRALNEANWFANADLGRYLREEKTARGTEYVMAETAGPGAIVRLWSANPGNRVWRIYLDGENTPTLEFKGTKLLSGKVRPWIEPFAGKRAMGANLIFPIPFAKSVKVTVSKRMLPGGNAPMMYYHVDVRLFPKGAAVKTFSLDDLKELEPLMTASAMDPPAAPVEMQKATLELAPGAASPLFDLTGPGAVTWFEVEVSGQGEELAEVLGRSLLTISFDSLAKPAVSAPLGDFFGSSPGAHEVKSLPASIKPLDNGALLESRWVMPFGEKASIAIANQSGKRLKLTARVKVSDRAFNGDSLYFHANWRQKLDIKTRPASDMTMVDVKGRGRFVGLEQNVLNPMEYFWWGEGDEKVFVDGEDFPSIFGTGTEDYFGYAWCVQYLKFTHAYHGVSVPTREWLIVPQALAFPWMWEALSNSTARAAAVSQYRWQILDNIPFQQSLKFDMEILHHRDTSVDVNATAFWYADAAATDDALIPDLTSRAVWKAEK